MTRENVSSFFGKEKFEREKAWIKNGGKEGEKVWGYASLCGGVGGTMSLALLVVQLQQAGLGGGPGADSAEDHGQVVAGLTDRLVSGGHQERGGDDHDQRDDGGENVGIDVLHDEFLLEDNFVIDEILVVFSGVLLLCLYSRIFNEKSKATEYDNGYQQN